MLKQARPVGFVVRLYSREGVYSSRALARANASLRDACGRMWVFTGVGLLAWGEPPHNSTFGVAISNNAGVQPLEITMIHFYGLTLFEVLGTVGLLVAIGGFFLAYRSLRLVQSRERSHLDEAKDRRNHALEQVLKQLSQQTGDSTSPTTSGRPQQDIRTTTSLEESSIRHLSLRLAADVNRLRRRAFFAFVPGTFLCLSALSGPVVSVIMIRQHPQQWQYMLGGSAVAVVLLGAGTALLRHDAKLREQMFAARVELLYFSRLQAGLDCAMAVSKEAFLKGLSQVSAHLLAAPPVLGDSKEPEGTVPGELGAVEATASPELSSLVMKAIEAGLAAAKKEAAAKITGPGVV